MTPFFADRTGEASPHGAVLLHTACHLPRRAMVSRQPHVQRPAHSDLSLLREREAGTFISECLSDTDTDLTRMLPRSP